MYPKFYIYNAKDYSNNNKDMNEKNVLWYTYKFRIKSEQKKLIVHLLR
jgi:hypothetical protein